MNKKWLTLVCILFVFASLLIACGQNHADEDETDNIICIGYQKNGPLLIVKALGQFEERLNEEGVEVEWRLFQAGPALTEAINTGSIDLGRAGKTQVILARDGNYHFYYMQEQL